MPDQPSLVERLQRRVRGLTPRLIRFAHVDAGATMTEYALLIGLIALVALAGTKTFGNSVATKFTSNAARVANP